MKMATFFTILLLPNFVKPKKSHDGTGEGFDYLLVNCQAYSKRALVTIRAIRK